METYTKLELQVLKNIRNSEYVDAEKPEELIGQPAWSFSITNSHVGNNGYTPNQIKGGMSSCVKKRLIGWDNATNDDECCWLTEKGVQVLIENSLF